MKDKSKKTVAVAIVILIAILTAMSLGILELFRKNKTKNVSTPTVTTGNVSVPISSVDGVNTPPIIKYQTILKDAELEDAFGNPL